MHMYPKFVLISNEMQYCWLPDYVCNAGGEFRTRDLQIMSIALVGEPLEFTKLTGTLTRLSYPGMIYDLKFGKLNATYGCLIFYCLAMSDQLNFSF